MKNSLLYKPTQKLIKEQWACSDAPWTKQLATLTTEKFTQKITNLLTRCCYKWCIFSRIYSTLHHPDNNIFASVTLFEVDGMVVSGSKLRNQHRPVRRVFNRIQLGKIIQFPASSTIPSEASSAIWTEITTFASQSGFLFIHNDTEYSPVAWILSLLLCEVFWLQIFWGQCDLDIRKLL